MLDQIFPGWKHLPRVKDLQHKDILLFCIVEIGTMCLAIFSAEDSDLISGLEN